MYFTVYTVFNNQSMSNQICVLPLHHDEASMIEQRLECAVCSVLQCYSAQYTVCYSAQYIVCYSVQYTVCYSVQYTVCYSAQYTVCYSAQYTFCNRTQYIVCCSLHYIVCYRVQCKICCAYIIVYSRKLKFCSEYWCGGICRAQCSVFSVQLAVWCVHCAVWSGQCTLFIVHYCIVLCRVFGALWSWNSWISEWFPNSEAGVQNTRKIQRLAGEEAVRITRPSLSSRGRCFRPRERFKYSGRRSNT